ncbi:MAG TPA: mercuric reductase [Stellaceae bacterium]|nr:mercuric reductase [Stellaceae bacterium]
MSTDAKKSEAVLPLRQAPIRAVGPAVLAVGGIVAAFGAASCCAIPMLLGGVGLGTIGSALFMPVLVPFQPYLLAVALACLVAGGTLLWRRQTCGSCGTRTTTTLTLVGLVLGVALLALGFTYG